MSEALQVSPDVIARRLGDSSVLVDLRTNRIYELNATGARIWELAETGAAFEEIVGALEEEFEASGVDVRREAEALVRMLQAEGLLGDDS